MKYILFCLFILNSLISFSQIEGYVVDNNKKGIADANIIIEGTKKGCITDKKGFFKINYNIACNIIVSHIRYKTVKIEITNINNKIQIILKEKTLELNTIDVNNKRNSNHHKINTSQKEIEEIPSLLGENDILKYLVSQAGINTTNGLDAGIYVRGGNSNHNEFLINNHNIYNPNHLSGILATFDPYAYINTHTYKSGFPARYGGKLSSYINMIPRIGSKEKYECKLKIGLLSSSIKGSGPLIKNHTSFVVSLRASYLKPIAQFYNDKYSKSKKYEPIPIYSFLDLTFNSHSKISEKISLVINNIISKDNLIIKHHKFKHNFDWGTSSSMAKISYYINEYSALNVQSGYNVSNTDYEINNVQKIKNKSHKYSWISKIDYHTKINKRISISTGIHHNYSEYRLNSNLGNSTGESILIYTKNYNLIALYSDVSYNLNEKISIESGLRFNKFDGETKLIDICPRARINYKYSEKINFHADFSKTVQYTTLYSAFSIKTPSDLDYSIEKGSKPSTCYQYSIDYSYYINENSHINVGLFYKTMKDIKEFNYGTNLSNLNIGNNLLEGEGEAKGFEIDFKLNSSLFNLQTNYTLSESTRQFKEINDGETYHPPFDIKHNFLINTSFRIKKNISINSMWTYSSGTYVTFPIAIVVSQDFTKTINESAIIPVYNNRYNFKLPDNHRLDINLLIKKERKKYNVEYAIGAYNIYNRANPTFLYFVPEAKDKYLNVLVPKIKTLLPFIPYVSILINLK